MAHFFVYLAVIVSGASVLAIELLGTRIIAPFYGASLYLWSALISVTLAALSLGYLIGGQWADRGATLGRFCAIIGIAGLWIALIPWMRIPVFALAEAMELRLAVLFCATVLFFPPLALLGMVSPYAIRMMAASLDVVGRTAGNLYAISTIASVIAALVTGFILIPNFGVARLAVLVGILLIGTACLGYAIRRRLTAAVGAAIVIVAIASLAFRATPVTATNLEDKILAIEQSAYAEIRVVEMNGGRLMIIDGSMHTGVDLSTWETVFEYVNVLELAKDFVTPGNMLLVGLGGGSVVKDYYQDGWTIDAVEIDPVVVRMAHEYFLLADSEATVYTMDGRQYLNTTDKTYDMIIMDAFGSSSIPFHLVTEEAIGLIRSRLRTDGVLAMNVQALGWHDQIVGALTRTGGRHFKHILAMPIAEPPNQVGNVILLMSDKELILSRDLPVPDDRFSREYDQAHAWDNRFVADTAGVPVLTDDLNPIDSWSERVNLASRKGLHESLAGRHLFW